MGRARNPQLTECIAAARHLSAAVGSVSLDVLLALAALLLHFVERPL